MAGSNWREISALGPVAKFALLVFCVCFVIAASGVFILAHENHSHDHDGPGGCCSVCGQMIGVRNWQGQIAEISRASGAMALGGDYKAFCAVALVCPWIYLPTLTELKIQINS
jgi:hypothetical protein